MPNSRQHRPARHDDMLRCAITGQEMKRADLVDIDTIWPGLAERIRLDHPDLPHDAMIARSEVARYRNLYFRDLLAEERGELSALDQQVARSLATHEAVATDVDRDFAVRRTLGEKLSDQLASFGGSWAFISLFGVVLAVWIGWNLLGAPREVFDPYPFILLNLVLSCIAALQAPIIMMSQKRQEAKDRLRSQSDYRVNLKAELEIRQLHEKIDHMLSRQWQRLAEIQELQIDMIEDRQRPA